MGTGEHKKAGPLIRCCYHTGIVSKGWIESETGGRGLVQTTGRCGGANWVWFHFNGDLD